MYEEHYLTPESCMALYGRQAITFEQPREVKLAPLSEVPATPPTPCVHKHSENYAATSKKKGLSKTGKKAMYHDDYETPIQTQTDETRKRQYLLERANSIFFKKHDEMRPLFNLDDDEQPKTLTELVERIKAGKYTFPKEYVDKKFWAARDVLSHISWRDPAKVKDEDGFEKASEELSAVVTKVRDTVSIADPVDGLKAVQSLETWLPTGKAN